MALQLSVACRCLVLLGQKAFELFLLGDCAQARGERVYDYECSRR